MMSNFSSILPLPPTHTVLSIQIARIVSSLLPSLPSSFVSPECGRVFYVLPTFIMNQTPNWDLLVSFLAVFLKLDIKSRDIIGEWER